ncbi:MAG: hypothetical protein AUI84_06995 [Delftia sp. 13_1_40CM_3_66_6]|nr:MAG: hypothetical protein AUI84_06995 [Delftia sp. 13_1_40CM_3_66_6]
MHSLAKIAASKDCHGVQELIIAINVYKERGRNAIACFRCSLCCVLKFSLLFVRDASIAVDGNIAYIDRSLQVTDSCLEGTAYTLIYL